MDNREKGGLKMECIKINLFKGMIRRVKKECSEITPRFIYDELESIHENIFCNQYEEKNNVYIVPNCDDKPIKFKIGE